MILYPSHGTGRDSFPSSGSYVCTFIQSFLQTPGMMRHMAVAAEHHTLARPCRLDLGPKRGPFHVAHLANVMHLQWHAHCSAGLAHPRAKPVDNVVPTREIEMCQCFPVDMLRRRCWPDILQAEHRHETPLVAGLIPQAEAIPIPKPLCCHLDRTFMLAGQGLHETPPPEMVKPSDLLFPERAELVVFGQPPKHGIVSGQDCKVRVIDHLTTRLAPVGIEIPETIALCTAGPPVHRPMPLHAIIRPPPGSGTSAFHHPFY